LAESLKKIYAAFYRGPGGSEPVREWLKALPAGDRRAIGNDIATVEFGWPIGMPTCRPLGAGLWEVRSDISGGRIARIIFSLGDGSMFLLHGFIKKTQRTSPVDLALARQRQKEIKRELG
jgi:phage-related protein